MKIAACFLLNNRSFYYVFDDSSNIKIGSKPEDNIVILDLEYEIQVSVSNCVVAIKKTHNRKTEHLSGTLNSSIIIDESKRIAIYLTEAETSPLVFDLPEDCEFSVGKSERKSVDGNSNRIILRIPYIGRYHFKIERHDGETLVKDFASRNGLFLNGVRIHEAKLKSGDILSILTVRFLYDGEHLRFENVGNALSIIPLEEGGDLKEAQLDSEAKKQVFVKRAPRIRSEEKTRIIDLEKPPQAGDVRPINWLSVLLSPAVMIVLLLVLVFALGMSPILLIMSGVMSVLSAIIAIINYRKQKKQSRQKETKIEEVYTAYLHQMETELEDARTGQLNALKEENPSPDVCARIIKNRDKKLWNRLPSDRDFLCARVGTGEVRANVTAKYHRARVVLEENDLDQAAFTLANRSQTISQAPIVCDLINYQITGISGKADSVAAVARNIMLELAVSHSYYDLKIILISDQNEQYWDWARWLPHCCDDQRERRYILSSAHSADGVLEAVEEELDHRAASAGQSDMLAEEAIPHYLFVISDAAWFERSGLYKKLLKNHIPGSSILCLKSSISRLPKECEQIMEVDGERGTIYRKTNSAEKTSFSVDPYSTDRADRAARLLAPLYTESDSGASDLPTKITFLEGYGVRTPEELDIGKRWSKAAPFRSLAVPIAELPGGERFFFDIHEKAHGVNGVVAGMPGAGKTEMVQSWLLSLAVNYSPQDVSFVLVDFKGTGLIAPFYQLPHLAGSISNLDTDIDRNLKALQNEVHRREEILSEKGRKISFNEFNRSAAAVQSEKRLPVLIIAIDEYAEFKKLYPDFGKEVDSLTSKGRELGIFVVLMTQKPAGVVSARSEDNIRFRWCLRVANYGASREMLGTSDAARISNSGRVIVKIGAEDLYQEMQSFWSGAPYEPMRMISQNDEVAISKVALNGARQVMEHCQTSERVASDETEIEAVVRYIAEFCKENGISAAEKVWTDGLPERLYLEQILPNGFSEGRWPKEHGELVIGLIDDPSNQTQYPLVLDFAAKGHTVLYGTTNTGKTTFLKTVIMSAATTRTPDSASIYLIDFGGWNLFGMQDLPHVGGVVSGNNPERLTKLMLLIKGMLDERKYLCRGVGTIASYRLSGKQIPDVILVIDNFDKLLRAYPDIEPVFNELLNSGANFGIYLVVTSAANGVTTRLADYFRNVLTLQLANRSDYSMIVGKVGGDVSPVVGRGYQKGNPPLAFQTALPQTGENDLEIMNRVKQQAAVMRASWHGTLPPPIPEMPEVIPYGSVVCNGVPLGLSVERVQPVAYDYSGQHYLLISGTSGSGKSNLLHAVSRALLQRVGGKLFCFDVLNQGTGGLGGFADVFLSSPGEIDLFIEQLRSELQDRYEKKRSDPSLQFSPIIFAIDDYSAFFKDVTNDTIERLRAIIMLGGGLDLYLLVAGDAYELTSLFNKGEAVTASLAKAAYSVMLGGTMYDHRLIQVKATSSQKNEEAGECEGFYVKRQVPVRFKAISCSEEGELK